MAEALSSRQYPTADTERLEVATVIQANLAAIGVKVKLTGYDWPTLLNKWDNGDLQAATTKWAPQADSHFRLMQLCHSKSRGVAGNYAWYSNPTVDKLIEDAVTETDPEKRKAMYKEVQRIFIDDAPWIFHATFVTSM